MGLYISQHQRLGSHEIIWSPIKEAQVSDLSGVRSTTSVSVYLGTWEDIKDLSKTFVLPPEIITAIAVYALKRDCNAVQINMLINDWVQRNRSLTSISQ